jgi:Tfp pilus assembly protein PilF
MVRLRSPQELKINWSFNYWSLLISYLCVFLFAFILYTTTFNHKYVLDDNDVIALNKMTQKGIAAIPEIFSSSYRADINFKGDDLYRPLSRALFAIEWEMWPDNPGAAHVVNVLIYALVCVLVFRILYNYIKEPVIPFMAVIIFAAMPIHTEAVANIKSADELLAMLFSLACLILTYKYSVKENSGYLVLSVLCFFAALLSKESAIVFILIIPMSIYFFTSLPHRKNLLYTSIHLIPLGIYLFIRYKVIGKYQPPSAFTSNYLAGLPDFFDREANAIMLLGYYILIIIFPYRLMSDGSYNEFPAITMTDWKFILPFIIFCLMLVFAIMKFRKKGIKTFFILFFFIAVSVVSNIFILIGTNYGERLMLAPSLAIAVLLAIFIRRVIKFKNQKEKFILFEKPVLVTLLLVLPYCMKTFARSAEWKDEMTLYANDAETARNSARAQYYLGNQFVIMLPEAGDETARNEYILQGRKYLSRAIEISPDYDEAYYSLGEIFAGIGNSDSASWYYKKAVDINPQNSRFLNNYADMMFKKDEVDSAKKYFQLAVKYDPYYRDAWVNLGATYSRIGQSWLEKAQQAQKKSQFEEMNSIYNVAMSYYDSAIVYVNKSIQIDPGFAHSYRVLGIIYENMNEKEKARENYAKAERMER